MKTIIELGLAFLLLAYTIDKLPSIVRNAKKGQLYLLKESSSSKWGKAWVPKEIQ